jgi:DNA-binding NtrC family response regulator
MSALRILVVDDDPVMRELVMKKLRQADYDEVETVENGVMAVDMIKNGYYDVVLTDLMMPGGVDGIGVLEAAKEKSNRTEVIVMTAFGSIENAVEAMKKGAADYLQKPLNFDELFIKLTKIGNMKRLVEEASNLREAMDITEKNASETIQELEMAVARLQGEMSAIRQILSKTDVDAETRVNMALEVLT